MVIWHLVLSLDNFSLKKKLVFLMKVNHDVLKRKTLFHFMFSLVPFGWWLLPQRWIELLLVSIYDVDVVSSVLYVRAQRPTAASALVVVFLCFVLYRTHTHISTIYRLTLYAPFHYRDWPLLGASLFRPVAVRNLTLFTLSSVSLHCSTCIVFSFVLVSY